MAKHLIKGSPVIYHYKEWRRVYYLYEGTHDWVDCYKHAIIKENPRDEYGRFTSSDDDYNTVKIMTEDLEVIVTEMRNIEPDRDPADLTKEESEKLWNEISHGSMYYSDYRNSVGVFENTALCYYEGYADECEYENKEETAEGFFWYCKNVEYFYAVA